MHDSDAPAGNRNLENTEGNADDLCVVGVGASAGGLEALERFFDRMPETTGMAFVVIQHLSPDFKSLMNELLARWTDMPIHKVEENMRVERNSIYLIPPKKEMIIANGNLHLTDRNPSDGLTLPIDHFFRSLAKDCGRRAVGIVLSGTGSDGSRGIADIHNAGGLVLAQREDTAKFDGMPRSAVETGVVDFIVPPHEMSDILVRYACHPVIGDMTDDVGSGAVKQSGYGAVFELLREKFGIDFSHYKPNTILRRTDRRLMLNKIHSLDDYIHQLADDPTELNALYEDLLIGVTQFFRDNEAFTRLGTACMDDILRRAKPHAEVRFWNAGCATGEEAYSMAILAHERMKKLRIDAAIKIFATDVHRASLEFASNGVYSHDSVKSVGIDRLRRYFVETADGFQVTPEIRKMVVFAPHNLIKDAPFTKLDLITCRNLLIYFQPPAQRKVLSLFHFGLKSRGILFLGPSESPGELSDEFDVIDNHWKIFRKRRDIRLPADMRLPLSAGNTSELRPSGIMRTLVPGVKAPDLSLLGIYDSLLDEFMPPAFLVNEHRELLHVFGGASKYLREIDGRPSPDFVDRLDAELRMAITGAFQRVVNSRQPVSYKGVRVATDEGEKFFRVTVKPFENKRDGNSSFLVMVNPMDDVPAFQEFDTSVDMTAVSTDQVVALETELRYAKENLQATVEELETSNEELQATNEELVASNEELQSTNEELHSVNEELYTVNAEHQRKISELTELSRDMNNLLTSTNVHTIFLDENMCIRKFTPMMGETFNLLPQDIGRKISSFTHGIARDDLVDDVRNVLETGETFECEVQDRREKWFLMRILPYHSESGVAGVVLTMIDISKMKQTSDALKESLQRRDQFLAMLSHELRNPMGAVLNALDSLKTTGDDVDHEHQVIRRQTRHMARLLDDLLDVARIHQNKIEFRKEPVDLVAMSRDVVEGVRHQFEAKDQILHVTTGNDPVVVYADPSRLKQAQVNLLNNAAKYTPKNGDVWYEIDQHDGNAIITVRDSGDGIPADLLDSIFDLFVQSDNTLDRAAGGMGVGLSLAKGIVQAHGGTLVAKSKGVGTGSSFCITLPLTTKPLRPKVPPPHYSFSGQKLLLVEDNDDARVMLAKTLRLSGFEVRDARDGHAALELCQSDRPEVAIIDIGLPGMNGYDLARRIRQLDRGSEMMLIALTGYGREEDRQKALSSGFDAHLVKPLIPAKLNALLAPKFASST